MNKLILRKFPTRHRLFLNYINGIRLESDDSQNKQPAEKLTEQKKSSEEALNKLNSLLNDIIKQNVSSSQAKLELAKPKTKNKRLLNEKKEPIAESGKVGNTKIVEAVKNVAETIGGDVKQTESELLMKLLSASADNKESLTDIVKGMKIDREMKTEGTSRAVQVRNILQRGQQSRDESERVKFRPKLAQERVYNKPVERIDLFGQKPLGIFNVAQFKERTEGPVNEIWDMLQKKELKIATTHPPANYFQEMILWTEQGKLWKFPIDNEQGLEKEKSVCFTEHVFLEKHLEPWCPQKGPIRHFMELVCVGLSKNPYLTVEAKKEHIEWFKNYFNDKRQLLREVGALQGHEFSGGQPKLVEG